MILVIQHHFIFLREEAFLPSCIYNFNHTIWTKYKAVVTDAGWWRSVKDKDFQQNGYRFRGKLLLCALIALTRGESGMLL